MRVVGIVVGAGGDGDRAGPDLATGGLLLWEDEGRGGWDLGKILVKFLPFFASKFVSCYVPAVVSGSTHSNSVHVPRPYSSKD